ncbi:hypothetical protein CU098_012944 [Rhizopus stolonifer]|uniref:Uncharacterized protein n=1 Tax=Rhizopus stolonifer TaxID=4846 RepID=A0A367KQ75_RHIST|nr:hypothetical protein CU098_012944 [Rhizopus stolonifer]
MSEGKKFSLNKHSEANHAKPEQHRCNAHLEDVLEGVTKWPLDVAKPFGVFLECLRSQPGNEPDRYKPSS